MKRPEVIWVGAFPFKIYFDHVKLAVMTADDGVKAAVGACNADKLEIVIDERLPEPRQRDVLIHEVLHAMWAFSGIRNADELTEEFVVDALSADLLYVLRVNPDFVEYLITGSPADNPEVRAKLDIYRTLSDEASGEGEEATEGEGK